MCEVCAIFGAGEHWSDFARLRDERFPFDDIMHYRKERARRLDLLNRILGQFDLSCEDWDGEAFAVYDKSGRMELAPVLNDVWEAAERLGAVRADPLSDRFFPQAAPRFVAEGI
ncbi:MAG: hypothetical protein WBG88_00850 [Mesorhizobium sp.]